MKVRLATTTKSCNQLLKGPFFRDNEFLSWSRIICAALLGVLFVPYGSSSTDKHFLRHATAVLAHSELNLEDVVDAFVEGSNGKGYKLGKLSESILTKRTVELKPFQGNETLEHNGFELVNLRDELALAGITEDNFDPSNKEQRFVLGSMMMDAAQKRFDGRPVLHLADTSRLTDRNEYGEATVRDTGSNNKHRGSHSIFHVDKYWPGIQSLYQNDTMEDTVDHAINYWRYWTDDWEKLDLAEESRKAMLKATSYTASHNAFPSMVNIWISLTKGGITQHPLVLIDPLSIEDQIGSKSAATALTVPMTYRSHSVQDTITLIRDSASARFLWQPRMEFGQAFIFDTTRTPHSAVWVEGVENAQRRSAELRALVL